MRPQEGFDEVKEPGAEGPLSTHDPGVIIVAGGFGEWPIRPLGPIGDHGTVSFGQRPDGEIDSCSPERRLGGDPGVMKANKDSSNARSIGWFDRQWMPKLPSNLVE